MAVRVEVPREGKRERERERLKRRTATLYFRSDNNTLGIDFHDSLLVHSVCAVLDERGPLLLIESLFLPSRLSTLFPPSPRVSSSRLRFVSFPFFACFVCRIATFFVRTRILAPSSFTFSVSVVSPSATRIFVSQPSEESCHEPFSTDIFSIDRVCNVFSSCSSSSSYNKMSAASAAMPFELENLFATTADV